MKKVSVKKLYNRLVNSDVSLSDYSKKMIRLLREEEAMLTFELDKRTPPLSISKSKIDTLDKFLRKDSQPYIQITSHNSISLRAERDDISSYGCRQSYYCTVGNIPASIIRPFLEAKASVLAHRIYEERVAQQKQAIFMGLVCEQS